MRVLIDVVYSLGIEERRPPLYTVYVVTLVEQELSQARAVLPGNTSDKRCLSQPYPRDDDRWLHAPSDPRFLGTGVSITRLPKGFVERLPNSQTT